MSRLSPFSLVTDRHPSDNYQKGTMTALAYTLEDITGKQKGRKALL